MEIIFEKNKIFLTLDDVLIPKNVYKRKFYEKS